MWLHQQTGLDLPVHTGLKPASTMTCTIVFLKHQRTRKIRRNFGRPFGYRNRVIHGPAEALPKGSCSAQRTFGSDLWGGRWPTAVLLSD